MRKCCRISRTRARFFSSEIDGFTFGWSLYPVGEFLTVAFMILRRRLLKTPARTSERRARSIATFARRPVSGARCRATCG
jgi:hypothetical protein